jgi:hypothetical protein
MHQRGTKQPLDCFHPNVFGRSDLDVSDLTSGSGEETIGIRQGCAVLE